MRADTLYQLEMLADEATSGWMTGAQLIVDTHPSQVDNKSLARACKVVDHIRYGRYFNDTLYFILYTLYLLLLQHVYVIVATHYGS